MSSQELLHEIRLLTKANDEDWRAQYDATENLRVLNKFYTNEFE